jgi:hypothetical protein
VNSLETEPAQGGAGASRACTSRKRKKERRGWLQSEAQADGRSPAQTRSAKTRDGKRGKDGEDGKDRKDREIEKLKKRRNGEEEKRRRGPIAENKDVTRISQSVGQL